MVARSSAAIESSYGRAMSSSTGDATDGFMVRVADAAASALDALTDNAWGNGEKLLKLVTWMIPISAFWALSLWQRSVSTMLLSLGLSTIWIVMFVAFVRDLMQAGLDRAKARMIERPVVGFVWAVRILRTLALLGSTATFLVLPVLAAVQASQIIGALLEKGKEPVVCKLLQ